MTQSNTSSTVTGSDIIFASFNCNGLNNPIKRSNVLHYLHHLGAHIIYLQETHLKITDHLKLKNRWVGQVYTFFI